MTDRMFKTGIPSSPDGMGTTQRKVPDDAPSTWPLNAELNTVGQPIPRIDATYKVRGEARYTMDVRLPNMLWGHMVVSYLPAARIISIDTRAAQEHPECRGVYVLEDINGIAEEREPGHFRLVTVKKDRSNREKELPPVRYSGQPVAAVAATSPKAAEAIARLVKVNYETIPFVVDMDRAMQDDAPLVFDGEPLEQPGTGGGGGAPKGLPQNGNVRGPSTENFLGGPRGDVEQGFAQADQVIEQTFETQVQTHSCLEPHALVANRRQEETIIYSSTQDTTSVRHEVAQVLDIPRSDVRVIADHIGGGFGSKYAAGNYGVAAVELSRLSGQPVAMVLTRKQEQTQTGNRPKVRMTLKLGAKKNGDLTALQLTSYGTAGAGLGAGAGTFAQGLYQCPNYAHEQYDVVTNSAPSCAFRGPGNTEGAFATEQMIDLLADRLNMNPLALREHIDPDPVRIEERRVAADLFGWKDRRTTGIALKEARQTNQTVIHGVGIGQAYWPRLVQLDSSAEVRVLKDGSVEVLSSVQDIGNGVRTVIGQVAAEVFGLPIEQVTVRIGDTNFPPGPGCGGSKATGSITPPVRNAAEKVKQRLFEEIADSFDAQPDQLEAIDGTIRVRGRQGSAVDWKEAAGRQKRTQIAEIERRQDDYGGFQKGEIAKGGLGAVQMAEVSIDIETGIVKCERVVAVHACGRPMNPLLLQSQINGGIVQGVGYALYENRILDQNLGLMVNPTMDTYKLPFAKEIPDITVRVIEDYVAQTSTDAYGVAEPANIPTAPAIANAFYNATGIQMTTLPLSPDAVLTALGRLG